MLKNVCPVFKKGDKHNAINYRPISLICIICKIMEHTIPSNSMKHLESNNILYDLQHGFRSSRSCETQLISFIQELAMNNNDKIYTNCCHCDGLCQGLSRSTPNYLFICNYFCCSTVFNIETKTTDNNVFDHSRMNFSHK
jgi:hypothetical protein